MKRVILFFLSLSAIGSFIYGQTQQGVVYRYNGKKARTPLGKVYIKVAAATNGVLSDSVKGTFTLNFHGLSMGARVGNVQVQKRGMMIFNQQAVDEWNIRKDPLCLILCDADEFEKQKQNLIAIGLREAKKRYDKKIMEIEAKYKAESAEWFQKLSEADEELQNTRKHLSEYADALARIDQSELDAQMLEILELYEKGEIQQAIQKLEDMHLTDKFKQTIERKQLHEQGLEAATQDSTLLIEKIRSSITLYQNCGEYDKAAECLKLLADKLNTPEDLFSYAHFCAEQGNTTDAISYYQKALLEYRQLVKTNRTYYEPYVAAILNNLALLYSQNQQFEKCEKLFDEALAICWRLKPSESQTFMPDLAVVFNNLATLYMDTKQYEKSENLFRSVLSICRKLAQGSPSIYDSDVAMTLNNFALLYYRNQRYEESEPMYREALDIYRRLALQNPQTYEPDVANTLNNLAILYSETLRMEDSEASYREALGIRRRLAAANPQAYESDLANTLFHLAYLYLTTQQLKESEAMYREVLEVFRRLASHNPKTYDSYLSHTLNNLAGLCYETKRLDECEALYREALEIRRRLASVNPQAYEPEVAWTLRNLATLYSNTQRPDEAGEMNLSALAIYQHLAASDPKTYNPYIVQTYGNQAFLHIIMKQYDKSEQMAKEGLKIDSTQHWIVTNLAAALLFQGKYAEAEALYLQYKDELKDGFLDDFRLYEEAGVIPEERKEDVERIKRMLNE